MKHWIAALAQDLRYAVRGFTRSPVFFSMAVLTIALGIGASSAVFSVVDRILFRPLPYPEADRLVSVGMLAPAADNNEFLTASVYLRFRERQAPFESMAAFAFTSDCDLSEANPVRLRCGQVDASFLPTFRIRPIAGRVFTPAEDVSNGSRLALLSYGFWTSRFAGDPGVVGKTITLDGQPTAVIGILPPEFELFNLSPVDLVIPAALAPSQDGRAVRAFARLKPGVRIEQARAALSPLFEQERQNVPAVFRAGLSLVVRGLRDRQIWPVRTASWTIFGTVAMVLLIASVNVANLMLARSVARRHEFAIRRALGAGRGRLLRQSLTESLLLSMIGAAAGCVFAAALLRFFVRIAPDGILRLDQATLDARVFLFAAAAATGSGLLFGAAPAMERLRRSLIAIQIAASLILLTGAGLLLQSLWSMERVPLGIDTQHGDRGPLYVKPQLQSGAPAELLQRARSPLGTVPRGCLRHQHPSVRRRYGDTVLRFQRRRPAAASEGAGGNVSWRAVTPGYFGALGIPIVRGGVYDFRHNSVVLSQSLATRLFGNEDPIGRHVLQSPQGDWHTSSR